MSLTNDQLLDRIVELEDAIEELSEAMNNLATRRELKNAVALISQTELTDEAEIEDRLSTLESTVNDLQTAANNLANRRTVNAAIALKQQEINNLTDRVTALESQVSILQSE